jgi:serine/threonine-protein kinase
MPIAGTDGAMHPFFSPDGQWVGFFADGKLKKVSLDGGAPVAIADARTPRGEAWGRTTSCWSRRSTAAGSCACRRSAARPHGKHRHRGELGHRWRFLPDGKSIVFSIWNDTGWEPSRIAVQSLDSAEHRVIVPAGGGYRASSVTAGHPGSDLCACRRTDGGSLRSRSTRD